MRIAVAVCSVLLASAAPAHAAIDVSALELRAGDVLTVTAADPAAPISGVAVDFGESEDRLALTACGRGSGAAGAERTFTLPHEFGSPLPRVVTVTVFSGGCDGPPDSVTRSVLVTPAGSGVVPDLPQLLPGGGVRARAAQACADATLVPARSNLVRVAAATRCLVNAERARRGLAVLGARKKLRRAAVRHVEDMIGRGYFAHARPGGPDLFDRLRAARFRFAFAGENLGAGTGEYATPAEMLRAWLLSPGHRANLLHPGYRLQGIGVRIGFPLAPASDDGATYAHELARGKS